MKDWSLLAQAITPPIPAPELARILPSLRALEEAFGPLARQLPPELEPAGHFHAAEEIE